MLTYMNPHTDRLTDADIREALDFLVAVEPKRPPLTREEYQAAIAPYRTQIDAAMANLRRFAEEIEPLTLEQMQEKYYSFTNNRRYLVTSIVSSVVTTSLNQAWDHVGPWRR
jgi:hypothetical protein